MPRPADRPAADEVDVILVALDAALQGVTAALPSDPLPPPVPAPNARVALDRLAAICAAHAVRLRAQRDREPDRLVAAWLGRHAWVWWTTGTRLREVGPVRAWAVVDSLRRRAQQDAVIAPACVRASSVLVSLLIALDQANPRGLSRRTDSPVKAVDRRTRSMGPAPRNHGEHATGTGT